MSKECSHLKSTWSSLSILKVKPSGLLFLQETHSTIDSEKKWKDKYGSNSHFSHDSSSSCGVFIAFYGNQDVTVKKKVVRQKRTSPCFRCTNWRLWFFAYEYL